MPGTDKSQRHVVRIHYQLVVDGNFADFCEMVWNRIPILPRVAVSLIYEAAILKLISILLGL